MAQPPELYSTPPETRLLRPIAPATPRSSRVGVRVLKVDLSAKGPGEFMPKDHLRLGGLNQIESDIKSARVKYVKPPPAGLGQYMVPEHDPDSMRQLMAAPGPGPSVAREEPIWVHRRHVHGPEGNFAAEPRAAMELAHDAQSVQGKKMLEHIQLSVPKIRLHIDGTHEAQQTPRDQAFQRLHGDAAGTEVGVIDSGHHAKKVVSGMPGKCDEVESVLFGAEHGPHNQRYGGDFARLMGSAAGNRSEPFQRPQGLKTSVEAHPATNDGAPSVVPNGAERRELRMRMLPGAPGDCSEVDSLVFGNDIDNSNERRYGGDYGRMIEGGAGMRHEVYAKPEGHRMLPEVSAAPTGVGALQYGGPTPNNYKDDRSTHSNAAVQRSPQRVERAFGGAAGQVGSGVPAHVQPRPNPVRTRDSNDSDAGRGLHPCAPPSRANVATILHGEKGGGGTREVEFHQMMNCAAGRRSDRQPFSFG